LVRPHLAQSSRSKDARASTTFVGCLFYPDRHFNPAESNALTEVAPLGESSSPESVDKLANKTAPVRRNTRQAGVWLRVDLWVGNPSSAANNLLSTGWQKKLAEQEVCCEPVSGMISLICRESIGYFLKLGPLYALMVRNGDYFSMCYRDIPCPWEV